MRYTYISLYSPEFAAGIWILWPTLVLDKR
jgi:hypothetical protein